MYFAKELFKFKVETTHGFEKSLKLTSFTRPLHLQSSISSKIAERFWNHQSYLENAEEPREWLNSPEEVRLVDLPGKGTL